MHAYIHIYIYVYTYIHTYLRTYTHSCVIWDFQSGFWGGVRVPVTLLLLQIVLAAARCSTWMVAVMVMGATLVLFEMKVIIEP